MEEHLTFNQGVPGSSPGRLTNVSDSFRLGVIVDLLLVPTSGSSSGTRRVEHVDPAPALARDPFRVVAQRGRRVRVAELRADVGDRLAAGEEQARERVAKIVEPEGRELGPLQRSAEGVAGGPRTLGGSARSVRSRAGAGLGGDAAGDPIDTV